MMTGRKQETGIKGEQIALSFLTGLGYRPVARNWRCRSGEIDLVMMDGTVMVFVEVKTRTGTAYGLPQEAVNSRKQVKIRRLAQFFLAMADRRNQEVRFDVVAVTFQGGREPLIEHLPGAF